MDFEYVPLLKMQREFCLIPHGFEHFRAYSKTMTDDSDSMELPLAAMNPMGKEHIPELLDESKSIEYMGTI